MHPSSKKKSLPGLLNFNLPIRFCRLQILLLGSGGLQIGQAGEFDYSGAQVMLFSLRPSFCLDLI
jgi:hypothetical protein